MYSKILFCIPPVVGWYRGWPSSPHVGIGYLSEFLTSNRIENEVIDMRLGYSVNFLKKRIRIFKPDLIAITMVTIYHEMVYKLIEDIKNPDYKIVVGGPHVSALKSEVLKKCNADFAVMQEGEYTLLELCNGNELKNIRGLIYRNGKEIIENEKRSYIEKLDAIPFPRYEKFDLDHYWVKKIPISTSRGCPYGCIYCSVNPTMGSKLRLKSIENVIEEVKYWYDRGYRDFDFVDDNFTFYRDRVLKFCDLLEEYELKNISFNCGNGIRADKVNRELLKRMKDVGFNYLAFGVESGNEKILKQLQKGESLPDIEKAIKEACDIGFKVGLFFIIGSPGETLKDVEDSFRLALKYPVQIAYFYTIIPYPGTELYRWVIEDLNYSMEDIFYHLRVFDKHDPVVFFETPEFTLEERKYALLKSIRIMEDVQKRYNERENKKLSRKFRFMMNIYSPVRRFFNYYYLLTWLLSYIENRKMRRFLLTSVRNTLNFIIK